jgi:hypothetical protein
MTDAVEDAEYDALWARRHDPVYGPESFRGWRYRREEAAIRRRAQIRLARGTALYPRMRQWLWRKERAGVRFLLVNQDEVCVITQDGHARLTAREYRWLRSTRPWAGRWEALVAVLEDGEAGAAGAGRVWICANRWMGRFA